MKIDLNDVACKVARAVYKADTNKDGWINSCEIFVSSIRRELLTSKGIKIAENACKLNSKSIKFKNRGEGNESYYRMRKRR